MKKLDVLQCCSQWQSSIEMRLVCIEALLKQVFLSLTPVRNAQTSCLGCAEYAKEGDMWLLHCVGWRSAADVS